MMYLSSEAPLPTLKKPGMQEVRDELRECERQQERAIQEEEEWCARRGIDPLSLAIDEPTLKSVLKQALADRVFIRGLEGAVPTHDSLILHTEESPCGEAAESGGGGEEGQELGAGVEVEYKGSRYLDDRVGALEAAADKCLVKTQTQEERKENKGRFLALWEEIKTHLPNVHENLITEAMRGELGLKIFMALLDQHEVHEVGESSVLSAAQTVEGCAMADKVWRVRRAGENYLRMQGQAWTEWREDCSPEEEAEAAKEREYFTGQMEEFKQNDEAVHECVVKAALDGYMGIKTQMAMVAYQEAVAKQKGEITAAGSTEGSSWERSPSGGPLRGSEVGLGPEDMGPLVMTGDPGPPPAKAGPPRVGSGDEDMMTPPPKKQPNPLGAIARSVPPRNRRYDGITEPPGTI